jgi:hypothetical protein
MVCIWSQKGVTRLKRCAYMNTARRACVRAGGSSGYGELGGCEDGMYLRRQRAKTYRADVLASCSLAHTLAGFNSSDL